MTAHKQHFTTDKSAVLITRTAHIYRQGNSRVIAVSKVLPRDWSYVKIELLEKNDDSVVMRVIRLAAADEQNDR